MTTPRQLREAAIGQGAPGVLGGSFDLWDGTRILCDNATRRGLTPAQGRNRSLSFDDIQLTAGGHMRRKAVSGTSNPQVLPCPPP